jgi:hypothetical protein
MCDYVNPPMQPVMCDYVNPPMQPVMFAIVNPPMQPVVCDLVSQPTQPMMCDVTPPKQPTMSNLTNQLVKAGMRQAQKSVAESSKVSPLPATPATPWHPKTLSAAQQQTIRETICLRYLLGTCKSKHCRFVHPDSETVTAVEPTLPPTAPQRCVRKQRASKPVPLLVQLGVTAEEFARAQLVQYVD